MTTTTLQRRPAHPDIDIDRAWKLRSRLYVSSGYHTRLRADLEALGAHWDTKRKAHWVGPAKQQAALEAVAVAEERSAHCAAVLAAGLWVRIPYDAEMIRARAKELGAVWCPDRREWAAPSDSARAELTAMVAEWRAHLPTPKNPYARNAAYAAAEHREQERRRHEEREIAREKAAIDHRARLLAAAGRTATGYHLRRAEACQEVLTHEQASELAHRVGDVLRLDDGRRAMVTEATVAFFRDAIPCPRAERDDHHGAHWCYRYRLDLLELTDAEIDAEVQQAAETADAHDIHQMVQWAAIATDPAADDHWSTLPSEQEAGRITVATGTAGQLPAGQLLITRDGRAIWQDPGQYDTYIRAEGVSTDPGLLRWAHSVLASGTRTRVVPGPAPLRYTVTVRCTTDPVRKARDDG